MADILIIDDDDIFGTLTLERLYETGWSAEFHAGPFGTLNALRKAAPRVAIVDVNMPGLDGGKLSSLVRKTPGLEKTKILLMSSMDQYDLEQVAHKHGIEAALSKSVSWAELLSVITWLLKSPIESAQKT